MNDRRQKITSAAGINPQKGEHSMLVKAKMNVRDASGWHRAGDVFMTDSDLGNAVEVLDAPKPVKAEPAAEVQEPADQPKPRASTRRKTTTK